MGSGLHHPEPRQPSHPRPTQASAQPARNPQPCGETPPQLGTWGGGLPAAAPSRTARPATCSEQPYTVSPSIPARFAPHQDCVPRPPPSPT
eukprot:5841452-Pleurochrysis_carterae.AAC.1